MSPSLVAGVSLPLLPLAVVALLVLLPALVLARWLVGVLSGREAGVWRDAAGEDEAGVAPLDDAGLPKKLRRVDWVPPAAFWLDMAAGRGVRRGRGGCSERASAAPRTRTNATFRLSSSRRL